MTITTFAGSGIHYTAASTDCSDCSYLSHSLPLCAMLSVDVYVKPKGYSGRIMAIINVGVNQIDIRLIIPWRINYILHILDITDESSRRSPFPG
jgi:hypothetical protein